MKKTKMHRKKSIVSRLLAMMLSLAMLFTSMPAASYAFDGPEDEEAAVTEPSEDAEAVEADEAGACEAAEDEEQAVEAGEAVAEGESESLEKIEINQGLSSHSGINDGQESLINDFVAKKQTVVMIKIPGSDSMDENQAKEAVAKYKLEAKPVTNGQESDNSVLSAAGENFAVKRAYTNNCDLDGWYAVASFPEGPDKGTYNFHITNDGKEIAENKGVNFYETISLNILVVPVNAYYSAHYETGAPSKGAFSCKSAKYYDPNGNEKEWGSLLEDLKKYLLDVYPIADITFEEGKEFDGSDPSYDMVNGDGQRKLWEEVCKMQSKNKEGKDRYDLILAFVQYRQDQGGGQGYTFGRPTNIITYSDKDMFPTVAHEIAHCYQVGDEYDGGSFNNSVNQAPNGYKGRDFVSGADITSNSGANEYWKTPKAYRSVSGSKNSKIDENGAGNMVFLSLHPYSLSQEKFICWAGVDPDTGNATGGSVYPTISWMGSGFTGCDGYYWTTAPIWDQLFKQFVKKEKKDAQPAEQSENSSNAAVYLNSKMAVDAEDDDFFDEDDFYFDEDYRFGDSRMVEVEGWLVKDKNGAVKAEMDPMFSYDGDLEWIDVLEGVYKDSKDIYTFAALDAEGKVIFSPVDGEPAVCEFNGAFYNPSTPKKRLKEVHFRFDAEYPEGTADFAVVKGNRSVIGEDGTISGEIIWRATADEEFAAEFDKKPEGYLIYADVNDQTAEVEWVTEYDGKEYDGADGSLLTEIYYCPEGDDGPAFYVGCSADEGYQEGAIAFETDSVFETKCTRNAYVWIKVTNGVNACDIYSDANEVTLCNSEITLSGAGIKAVKQDGETVYSAEYSGKAITPNTSVKAYNPATGKYVSLKKDVDYTVSYENNVEVGYAAVSVQGIGLYAGKNTQEFEITKKKLSMVPENIPNLTYSADMDSAVLPYFVLKDAAGKLLEFNRDFTVEYSADGTTKEKLSELIPEAPAEAVTVSAAFYGKGNYSGKCAKTVSFDVLPAEAETILLTQANTVITLKKDKLTYSGKALKAAVKSVEVTDAEGNKVKLKASEYKLVYTNNVSIGTARVTVVGKKGCSGSAYATFEIAPKEVKSLSVSGLKNQVYTGEKVDVNALPIVVKAGGITLTKGIDYTVEAGEGDYTNITAKGQAKPEVIIRLISAEDAAKAGKKKTDYPKVVWASNVKEEKQVVKKNFSIVQLKLNSSAVSLTTKSSTGENPVKVGDQTVATIRSATRAEITENKKKYTFVIEGTEDELSKDAVITEGAVLKAFGKELALADYSVSVSKTKDGSIGTITFKAVKGGSLSGKKVVKFLYIKTPSEEEE